jgi:hypothetical protein
MPTNEDDDHNNNLEPLGDTTKQPEASLCLVSSSLCSVPSVLEEKKE